MARRKSNKIEPSVMSFILNTPPTTGGSTGQFTCDLSQVASLMNRRFYRQGINWAVAGIKIISSGSGTVLVKKLPNTWVLSNAWEKGMRTWLKMSNEALSETESVRPKFMDYKIYADSVHHNAGYGANLLPLGQSLVAYTEGEWDASVMSIPVGPEFNVPNDINEYEIIATGANYPGASPATTLDAVSLIEGYAASRALPNLHNPNTPADSTDVSSQTPENWMVATFNEGTDQTHEVLENLELTNMRPPYPYEGDSINPDTMYPNGANQAPGLEIHDWVQLSGTTIGGQSRAKGGNFPCGLMRFDWTPETTSNIIIQVDLVPGNHRGYLCEPMTEM